MGEEVELLKQVILKLEEFDVRMNRLEVKGDKMFTLAKGIADKL